MKPTEWMDVDGPALKAASIHWCWAVLQPALHRRWYIIACYFKDTVFGCFCRVVTYIVKALW